MKLTKIDSNYVLKFKALSQATRLKMLPHLSEPRTVKQIADMLRMDHHGLYHHMKVLEDAGIVKRVKTKRVHNLIEKYYQLTDNWVSVPYSREEADSAGLALSPLIQQAVFSMLEDLTETTKAGNDSGQVHRVWYKIRSDKLKKKHKEVEQIIKKFIEQLAELEDKDGDVTYSLNLVHFKMSPNDSVGKQS